MVLGPRQNLKKCDFLEVNRFFYFSRIWASDLPEVNRCFFSTVSRMRASDLPKSIKFIFFQDSKCFSRICTSDPPEVNRILICPRFEHQISQKSIKVLFVQGLFRFCFFWLFVSFVRRDGVARCEITDNPEELLADDIDCLVEVRLCFSFRL